MNMIFGKQQGASTDLGNASGTGAPAEAGEEASQDRIPRRNRRRGGQNRRLHALTSKQSSCCFACGADRCSGLFFCKRCGAPYRDDEEVGAAGSSDLPSTIAGG